MGYVIPTCRQPIPDGFSVFPRQTRRALFKTPVDPPSEFRPFLESSPVQPSRPPNRDDPTTRPLSWAFFPYSTFSQRGPLVAGFACPHRSVPRVWLPSRRLTPPMASPVLSRTGSAHGIYPFGAYSSRKVSESFPPGSTHVPFLPTLFPSAETEGRPVEPRVPGLLPLPESSGNGRVLKASPAGCSPGFFPLEV